MNFSHKIIPLSVALIFCLLLPLFGADKSTVYVLSTIQLILFYYMVRERKLTALGSFTFMYVLFFAVRPIYLVLQDDYKLFDVLFLIDPKIEGIVNAQWWATLGLILFLMGGLCARFAHAKRWIARSKQANETVGNQLPNQTWLILLFFLQIGTLGIMAVLASSGTALYGSAVGAYLYDLPMAMQAAHVLVILLLLEKWLQHHSTTSLIFLIASCLLCILFTYLMRNVSNFRGFYLTGLMVAGIAAVARLKLKVSYAWLCVPILIALPIFRILGETRAESAAELLDILPAEATGDEGFLKEYWNFFEASGDMNIFDTFVAANESKPEFRPYVYSWLYVPVHFIPRAIWKSKPEKGILIDYSFMNGAPYSAGISGFFLLDGGKLWMLGCMVLLGYILAWFDYQILTMPYGYLRCCLYAIHVVNGMYLTRFYLWQWFYQALYMAVPCLILAWALNKTLSKKKMPVRKRRPLTA